MKSLPPRCVGFCGPNPGHTASLRKSQNCDCVREMMMIMTIVIAETLSPCEYSDCIMFTDFIKSPSSMVMSIFFCHLPLIVL